MKTIRSWSVAALWLVLISLTARAQTTWTGAGGDANVSTAGNWNPSGAPSSSGASLSFPSPVTATTVNFDSAYSVNSLTFSGSSSYSLNGSGGGTTLTIGAGGVSDSASAGVFINNAVVLSAAATFSTGASNLTFASTIDNGGHGLTLSSTGGALSVLGNLTGTGALTITNSGPGLVFLNGAGNTWSGGTTISSGTLQIGNTSGTSTLSLPGNVTDNGTINFKPSSSSFSYSGVISGSGSLQMLGTNILTLTGANTFAGTTTIASGTIQIGTDNALPTTTALSMNGTNSANLDVSNNQTIDHFGGNSAGSTIMVASTKTLTVSQASATSSTFNGVISGLGKLVVTGSATSSPLSGTTVQFTGSNTFSGGTTINGGILKIASGGVLGSGGITVNSGAILTGSGSFTGALVVNSGGAIAVSSTLSGGTATFNGGSTYFWALTDASGNTAGTNHGILNITGGLALSATSGNRITIAPITFNGSSPGSAANFDPTQNYSFTLATTTTGITGFDATAFAFSMTNFQNAYTGTWAVGTSGNNLVLNYTGGSAIPEPATSALLAGLAACGLALRRRRRSQPLGLGALSLTRRPQLQS